MRAFWIATVLFLLMALVIVGSMGMNRYVCGTMRRMTEALADDPVAGAGDGLEAFWLRWRAWMRPTMNQTVWRGVNDLVASLAAYADLGESAAPEYAGVRCQLLLAIEEMSRPERAALQNLL